MSDAAFDHELPSQQPSQSEPTKPIPLARLRRAAAPSLAHPRGWYRLALSSEVRADRPTTVRAFGADAVLFRDEHGRACALDAWCPHLGANLGDGQIVHGRIRCPFHGWCFDSTGKCDSIPHARRIPGRAAVRSWPVEERDGIVFTWFHPLGAPPDFAVPRAPEVAAGWGAPVVFRRRLRARLIDVKENIVDFAHFPVLHRAPTMGFAEPPRLVMRRSDGHRLRLEVESDARVLGLSLRTRIKFTLHGPGVEEARVLSPVPVLLRFVTTPIDDETLDFAVAVHAPPSLVPGLQRAMQRFFRWRVGREVGQDARIWEHKTFQRRPVLSEADGPIMALRSFLSQFYEPEARARLLPQVVGREG